MRAFFAVDIPEELASGIADVQEELHGADGLRFTDPEQAHVTLAFLGDVPAETTDGSSTDDSTPSAGVDAVTDAGRRAVAEANTGPFTVSVGGLGVFPSMEYISVVWTGIGEGSTELARLHETIEERTVALGYEPDEHEFTPHVTLARMNDARGKDLVQRVVRNRDPDIGTFTAEQVQLKRSRLTSSGPVYETVESFPLSA
ncbi:RNA 2',3'-cyclic phosphodiesterase [Halopenitus sp. H-Gu1]|uniref:RNA 2',3'-cyclic phosphodiesterase n=1 Tax=Halopenitus sp. H-Gu1 TaxID=3242697 RepID=UPI00359D8F6F